MAIPHTVDVVEKLRRNCHLGKHKHFEASTRGRLHHVLCGVPVMVINVLLGSAMFIEIQKGLPASAKWGGAFLALGGALLVGVQTFFNFGKEFLQHRTIGNRYLSLARDCERLIALYFDGQLSLQDLSSQIEALNERYCKITQDAETLTTRDTDFKKAEALQKKKDLNEPSVVERYRAALASPPIAPIPAAPIVPATPPATTIAAAKSLSAESVSPGFGVLPPH